MKFVWWPTPPWANPGRATRRSNQAEGDGGEGINHDELISPMLRRGRRITDDTRSSEESEESEEEGEGSDKPDPVAWSMPDGFTLGAELQARRLDRGQAHLHALEGLRLAAGQVLGKVYEQITNANPRLFKKFNYRVVWADNAKGPTSLRVENYAHGSDAALDSWVLGYRLPLGPKVVG